MLPRQRRRKLVVEHLADETLIYDEARHRAHCLNRTAALVWRHCDGRTTVAQLAGLLRRELKAEVSEEIVLAALDDLARAQLLEPESAPAERLSRRRAARQLAVAGAASIVASITAPVAAQAASVGDCCNSVAQCRAGLNCVGHSHPECRRCPNKCCV